MSGMILKYGLNVPKKKQKKSNPIGNVFNQIGRSDGDPEVDVSARAVTQGDRQRQKAEQEKLRLLAEDPNVFAFDEVYETMAAQQQHRVAAKEASDATRQPKYFDKLQKRCEERKIEQGVIYQRGIVRERVAEDHLFKTTEAFVTAGYKAQMIKDKAWQTQQDVIDKKETGPTTSGMAGGFLSTLMNSTIYPDPSPAQPIQRQDAVPEKQSNTIPVGPIKPDPSPTNPIQRQDTVLERQSNIPVGPTKPEASGAESHQPVSSKKSAGHTGAKRTHDDLEQASQTVKQSVHVKDEPAERPAPITLANKAEIAAAARERFLKRKAEKELQQQAS